MGVYVVISEAVISEAVCLESWRVREREGDFIT